MLRRLFDNTFTVLKQEVFFMSRITLLKSIITTISGLLGSKEFLERHRLPNRFVRSGMLSMYHVVMYLLYSTRQAMHQNISRIIDLEPVRFPDVSKQAVSKARQGIMPSLFRELFDETVKAFSSSPVPRKLWRGRETVYAVDGSKIQLPNSASNFEVFGNMFRRDNPGRRWSMALASVIYDVTNDFICHGVLRRFLASERTAAIDHCKALEALGILKGAVLVFDVLILVAKVGGEAFGDLIVQIGEDGIFRGVEDGVPFVLDIHARAWGEGDSMGKLPGGTEGIEIGHASAAA